MKPLVKKYSLPREMAVKAAEVVMCSFVFQTDVREQKKRVEFIVSKSMADSIDKGYEKIMLRPGDIRFSDKEYTKFYRQARTRFLNLYDRVEALNDEKDENHTERVLTRNQAFECSYLCLRTEDPESAFYVLWGYIDMYKEWFDEMRARQKGSGE